MVLDENAGVDKGSPGEELRQAARTFGPVQPFAISPFLDLTRWPLPQELSSELSLLLVVCH